MRSITSHSQEIEYIFWEVVDESNFDPTKLPVRTHETFMRDNRQKEWEELMELLRVAAEADNEERVDALLNQLSSLRPPIKKVATKKVAKKAVAKKPVTEEELAAVKAQAEEN